MPERRDWHLGLGNRGNGSRRLQPRIALDCQMTMLGQPDAGHLGGVFA